MRDALGALALAGRAIWRVGASTAALAAPWGVALAHGVLTARAACALARILVVIYTEYIATAAAVLVGGAAVWLLLNSAFAEVVTARLKAYKDRLIPPRPPPE